MTIAAPVEGQTIAQNAVVNASYTCAGDGVVSCEGPVANGAPIPTNQVGPQYFTVIARNASGVAQAIGTARYTVDGPIVSPTLHLDLSPPTPFGAFVPGVAKDYTSTTVAAIFSTADDTTLTVADASTTNVGRMVNGTHVLTQPVQVGAVKGATTTPPPSFAALGGTAAPTQLLTYDSAVRDAATITFKQSVSETDALRTGTYSKTLTFTLSTTAP
ncbi:hypothetical protein [Solirubrobacter deserti]|uniref:WxL domain-containing protein n=1 Tax=Solirubrobacter deserti TaxID=2282478 RepID=A0ABT4RNY5_9ACTN|nr:hypothetical protein [Solirubrobacter deserti]MDA0140264.1 hypothetical protein [Solirubrobacter deserti]